MSENQKEEVQKQMSDITRVLKLKLTAREESYLSSCLSQLFLAGEINVLTELSSLRKGSNIKK